MVAILARGRWVDGNGLEPKMGQAIAWMTAHLTSLRRYLYNGKITYYWNVNSMSNIIPIIRLFLVCGEMYFALIKNAYSLLGHYPVRNNKSLVNMPVDK